METTVVKSDAEQISTYAKFIDDQLAKLTKRGDGVLKTNGLFRYSPVGASIDFSKTSDIEKIIEMASHVISKEASYDKAAKELNLETYPEFKWLGYTKETWLQDFETRINVLTYGDRYQQLKAAQKNLESLYTEEMKRKKVLESLGKTLGLL